MVLKPRDWQIWPALIRQPCQLFRYPLQVTAYRIAKGRAFLLTGPKAANKEQGAYWDKHCGLEAEDHPEKLKTFGTPKAGKHAGG